MPRVLHVLSQRPSLTGSGITLDALVRHAAVAGWEQRVVIGVPREDPAPPVGGLDPARIHPLVFESDALPFPVPGMSDVMPYRSSRWSQLSPAQLTRYREAWRAHLRPLAASFRPELIHSHHLWILSSLLSELFPEVPILTHSHATGLRQMQLCPHLAPEIRRDLRRNRAFLALHAEHRERILAALDVVPQRVHVVGAGIRADLFHARGRAEQVGPELLYAGKYSHAKGLPWLLDALERLGEEIPELTLHIAGSGAGEEAEALRARMEALAPRVVLHGMLSQEALAERMRRAAVFVLPSFYEGLPLVLAEALACGATLVCTELPGVQRDLAPLLGEHLEGVPLPRLRGPDVPEPADLPQFVDHLAVAIRRALAKPSPAADPEALAGIVAPFGWGAVFARVEPLWHDALAASAESE